MSAEPPANVKFWMPLYLQRHRAATSTMSHTEHSAFVYLSILLWENDGRLRDDDKWLARNLRLTAREWQGARDAVLQPFTAAAGFITDPEMIAEIERRKAVVEKKRAAGSKGGKAKAANQAASSSLADAKHVLSDAPLSSTLSQGGSEQEQEAERPFRLIETKPAA